MTKDNATRKFESYKKGDRVWQFETGVGNREILERTVEHDSGEDESTVRLFEGSAHGEPKVFICRWGDVESANHILEKITVMYDLESDVRSSVRIDFLSEQKRTDLIDTDGKQWVLRDAKNANEWRKKWSEVFTKCGDAERKNESLSAELERVSDQLSDVWLYLDKWARQSHHGQDMQRECRALLQKQQAPGWK